MPSARAAPISARAIRTEVPDVPVFVHSLETAPEGSRVVLAAAFFAAGLTRAQVLEVVLGVAMKTLSNYANHLAGTPLDEAFAAARWEQAKRAPVG